MKDVLEGFNGSIFAYGQTSSGKTHTLLGTREQPGVIILTVQELLTTMASQSSVKDYMMSVSYVEVYNENLVDLLDMSVDAGASKAGSGGLRIFEDKTFGPFVRGITVAPISKPEQVVDFLFSGERRRSYAFTEMNSRSSRSHTVFQIMVESRVAIDGGGGMEGKGGGGGGGGGSSEDAGGGLVRRSVLNIVDLAGSERAKKTGATTERLKESGNINKSLMALTQVIYKLSANGDAGHINFRDSKLTRLLSNALGGNSRTAAIACLCPTSRHMDESLGTLQFAMRAKRVINRASVNTIAAEDSSLGSLDAKVNGR